MSVETQNSEAEKSLPEQDRKRDLFKDSVLLFVIFVGGAAVYFYSQQLPQKPELERKILISAQNNSASLYNNLEEKIVPSRGVTLPVRWGDFGKRMVEAGVIDAQKFEQVYSYRAGLSEADKELLYGNDSGNLIITPQNSGMLLNLLWAFGLGNKNEILEKGPMVNYDGKDPVSSAEALAKAGRFASTGGWTLAKGDPSTHSTDAQGGERSRTTGLGASAMEHYSRHAFVVLTPEQQQIVERVSKGIFRPCCNNPTYFPDCNHGMAMLGLLELMAAQGVSEEDMYKVALQVNAYWFPDTYLTIAKYLEMKGISWEDADPKGILGFDFSSASGFQQILQEVTPPEGKGGGSCGV